MQLWKWHSLTYRILGTDIDMLTSHPKPSKKGMIQAQNTIYMMADWQADTCSAQFCDEKGQPLAACFAKCIIYRSASQRRVGMVSVSFMVTSHGAHMFALRKPVMGHTLAAVDAATATGCTVSNDNIKVYYIYVLASNIMLIPL